MIQKRARGYYVFSTEGRLLGGPYQSWFEARRRLDQVEYFRRARLKPGIWERSF